MNSNVLLFALLIILVASTGFVWAAASTPERAAQTAPAERALETTLGNPNAADVLESLTPAQDQRTASCAADCFTVWEDCITACSADTPCRQGCGKNRKTCVASC